MKNLQSSVVSCQLRFVRSGLVALIFVAWQSAQAHPGHALGDHGMAHLVTSPFHVVVLLGLALCCWCAAWFVRHAFSRQVLRFAAAGAVLAAAFLWSFMA